VEVADTVEVALEVALEVAVEDEVEVEVAVAVEVEDGVAVHATAAVTGPGHGMVHVGGGWAFGASWGQPVCWAQFWGGTVTVTPPGNRVTVASRAPKGSWGQHPKVTEEGVRDRALPGTRVHPVGRKAAARAASAWADPRASAVQGLARSPGKVAVTTREVPTATGSGLMARVGAPTSRRVALRGGEAALLPRASWTTATATSAVDHQGGVTLKVA